MDHRFLVFLTVVTLLTVTPGADMAVVTRAVLTGGRRAAAGATAGIMVGCMVWALASAAGLAALLAASETAYDALRLAGAGYLVLLGVQSLMAARANSDAPAGDLPQRPGGPSPFRQGLLTNVFNPKIAVFYSALLPQFIGPGDPVLAWSILLAGVHIALGVAWLTLFALLVDRAAGLFRASRVRRALDALTGTVLVALGLRLALEPR